MAKSRTEPLSESATLRQRMSAVFHTPTHTKIQVDSDARDLQSAVGFVPPVDIYADDDHYVLELEIPGMDQDDLDIRLEPGALTIRGERKLNKGRRNGNFSRLERRYGTFFRAFPLPRTVDVENVEARYEAGILRITLAHRSDCESRQIKVDAPATASKPIHFVNQGSKSVA
jgi:HSP20 family protein